MTATCEIGKRRVRLAGANTGEICQRAADLGARRVLWPWGCGGRGTQCESWHGFC